MPPLSVMIKPVSAACNLACKYCFYHDVASSRREYAMGVMDRDTARALIKGVLDFAGGESVYFAFQGGEPLLAGKEYFAEFAAIVDELNVRRSKICYAVQTNGTLLDEEWCAFFKRKGFLVGLSLDGDKDANRFRVDADGGYSYPAVAEGARLLTQSGVDFNIVVVATGYTARNVERIYRALRDEGFKFLQFIPCLRPFGCEDEGEMYMTVEQYGDFLIRLFNLYVKDYVSGDYVSVRQLDNYVRLFLGESAEQCGMNGGCSHQLVVEGNGNVYPCDFYCLDEWFLGNVNTRSVREMASGKRAADFIKSAPPPPKKCLSCSYGALCRAGGCRRSREDRDYCEAYKKFFSACLPLFRVFIGEKRR